MVCNLCKARLKDESSLQEHNKTVHPTHYSSPLENHENEIEAKKSDDGYHPKAASSPLNNGVRRRSQRKASITAQLKISEYEEISFSDSDADSPLFLSCAKEDDTHSILEEDITVEPEKSWVCQQFKDFVEAINVDEQIPRVVNSDTIVTVDDVLNIEDKTEAVTVDDQIPTVEIISDTIVNVDHVLQIEDKTVGENSIGDTMKETDENAASLEEKNHIESPINMDVVMVNNSGTTANGDNVIETEHSISSEKKARNSVDEFLNEIDNLLSGKNVTNRSILAYSE